MYSGSGTFARGRKAYVCHTAHESDRTIAETFRNFVPNRVPICKWMVSGLNWLIVYKGNLRFTARPFLDRIKSISEFR
jgi:hypothetical protein